MKEKIEKGKNKYKAFFIDGSTLTFFSDISLSKLSQMIADKGTIDFATGHIINLAYVQYVFQEDMSK